MLINYQIIEPRSLFSLLLTTNKITSITTPCRIIISIITIHSQRYRRQRSRYVSCVRWRGHDRRNVTTADIGQVDCTNRLVDSSSDDASLRNFYVRSFTSSSSFFCSSSLLIRLHHDHSFSSFTTCWIKIDTDDGFSRNDLECHTNVHEWRSSTNRKLRSLRFLHFVQ